MPEHQPDRRNKGAATRDRILVEARRTLINDGYDAFVLRTVAERLDMKLGNLQYYFRTRDDLLLEVIRREALSDLESMRVIVEQEQPPLDALRQLVHALVGKWRADSGVVFTTLAFLSLHREPFRAVYRDVYSAFYDELERAIECAEPGHERIEYQQRARLLTALIDGAAMQTQTGPRGRFLESVLEAAMRIAIAPWPTRPSAVKLAATANCRH